MLFVFGHMVLHLVSSGITFRGLVDRIDWFHYSSLGVLNALPIMLFAFSCVIWSSTVTLHFYISVRILLTTIWTCSLHFISTYVVSPWLRDLCAFSCQLNVYSIQSELEVPTMARMSRIMKGAIAICLSVYLTIGVGGYIEFQTSTKGNILLNYDPAAEPVMLIPFLGELILFTATFHAKINPSHTQFDSLPLTSSF